MNWWRWQCRECAHQFVLKKNKMPVLVCRRCYKESWFDKIKEQETKTE